MKLEYPLDKMPAEILRHTTRKIFLPGTAVVSKGGRAEHVYLILKGSIRVSNEFISGQRYTFARLDTMELIGDLEVLASQAVYSATCEATVSCECLSMSAATFMHWMKIDSAFAVAVARQLASKMYPTSNENGRIKFQPSLDRLHDYLCKRLGDIDTDLFILHTSRRHRHQRQDREPRRHQAEGGRPHRPAPRQDHAHPRAAGQDTGALRQQRRYLKTRITAQAKRRPMRGCVP